ncbi:SMI1/KNR4 family protein [Nitrincola lacisaponensis]|uniref:SMI1/KNR4 family protein n=1 Tax=Nitrincola lacisaponensis TaxID=267850 RepID=UPI0005671874|nr:SMI1/KNR4 family protein [Nitrincola lacisaponensis]
MTKAMHQIESILAKNEKYRLDEPIPPESEMDQVELALKAELKGWYRDFVRLGGLNDLRFSAEILAPQELLENQIYVKSRAYIAFASNGCGDLFCWSVGESPAIFLWDHETNRFTEDAPDFISWLERNRF